VIASTNPNRVTWASGSINVPGSPQIASEGGYPYIDNNETPGCETGGYNCYPLSWKTTAEIYEDAGVSVRVSLNFILCSLLNGKFQSTKMLMSRNYLSQ
jgi:phospholipase C